MVQSTLVSYSNKHIMEKQSKKTFFGFQEIPWSEKQAKVNEVFNSVARKYDLMNDLMSAGLHRLWKDEAIRALAPQDGETILDLAGGTGDLTARILNKIQHGKVILSDINVQMLQEGIKRLDRQGKLNIAYALANAEALPFSANSIDGLIIGFGLRNVRDQQSALNEMQRVVKPRGRVVILEFSEINQVLKKPYDFYSFKILPKMGQIIAGDAESYVYLAESIRKHPNQETLKNMLLAAGFAEVNYRNLLGGLVSIHLAWKA